MRALPIILAAASTWACNQTPQTEFVPWSAALACDGGCGDTADGGPTPDSGLGSDGSEVPRQAAYRVTSARILDPHLFTAPPLLGCRDVTDDAPVGQKSANERLARSVSQDTDNDGFIDLSVVLSFDEAAGTAEAVQLEVFQGDCEVGSFECFSAPPDQRAAVTASSPAEHCLIPADDEVSSVGYSPAVPSIDQPCFVSSELTLALRLDRKTTIVLTDTTMAATSTDSGRLTGLLRGFVSVAEADRVEFKGDPLREFLPGGEGCCARHDDLDANVDELGWWFFVEFDATPIALKPPPLEAEGCCAVVARPPPRLNLAWFVLFAAIPCTRRARASRRSRPPAREHRYRSRSRPRTGA